MYDISPLAGSHLSANKLCLHAFWQVSKLYEVVPPILLAGGKVSHVCTALNKFVHAQFSLVCKHTIPGNLCWIRFDVFWQVKNPWPNVDAHSGVLLQYYGLKEEKWASPPSTPQYPTPCIQGWYNRVSLQFNATFPNNQLLTESPVEWMDYPSITLVPLGHCGFSQLSLCFLLHKTFHVVFSTLFIIDPNWVCCNH